MSVVQLPKRKNRYNCSSSFIPLHAVLHTIRRKWNIILSYLLVFVTNVALRSERVYIVDDTLFGFVIFSRQVHYENPFSSCEIAGQTRDPRSRSTIPLERKFLPPRAFVPIQIEKHAYLKTSTPFAG